MSNKIKNVLGGLLIISGALGCLGFLVAIWTSAATDKTIERNREILAEFQKAASFVDSFKESNQRLPSQKEIEIHFGENYVIEINNDYGDVNSPDFIKAPPAGSFFLSRWRGEWAEYYAGWNKQTTLTLDKNHYFPFGSPALTYLATFLCGIAIFVGRALRSTSKPRTPGARATLEKQLQKFSPFFLKYTALEFTEKQKIMLAEKCGMKPGDKIETSFFNFAELDNAYIDNLWQYGLSMCGLERKVEAGKIVPFAALNTNGARLAYGAGEFAETNNWGILCFDFRKAVGDDCPVIWVYDGDVISWTAKASELSVRILPPRT